MRLLRLVVLPVLALIGGATLCFAQFDRASLNGTVTDSSGAIVPEAAIAALQVDTQSTFTTKTNGSGLYSFSGLPIGNYTISAEKAGFAKLVRTGVILMAGSSVRADLTLTPGVVTQRIEVTSNASPLIDERSSVYGVSEDTKTLEELPLEVNGAMRAVYDWLATVPGSDGSTWAPSIMGTPIYMSEIMIDGVGAESNSATSGVNMSDASVETISEFKVVDSVSAEYGLTGGAFVSYTTRSGSNTFHGDAYEYARNEGLDTRSFFAPDVAVEKQHEFGVSAGGPVVIPRVYDGRDKTFFFGTFTNYRFHYTSAGQVLTLPTPSMLNGDFSALLGPQIGTDALGRPVYSGAIYDPSTTRSDGQGGFIRDPFPGNIIPSSRFSPVSSKLQSFLPTPSLPGVTNNYVAATSLNTTFQYSEFVRIDHNLQNGRIYGTFKSDSIVNTAGEIGNPMLVLATGNEGAWTRSPSARFSFDRILRPDLVNTFAAGMDRYGGPATFLPNAQEAVGAQTIGLTGIFNNCTPAVAIAGGYPSIGAQNCFQTERDTNFKFTDTLSWIKGKHSLKFGGNYYRWRSDFIKTQSGAGIYAFSPLETALPGSFDGSTGSGYASFLLGEVDNAQIKAPFEIGIRSYAEGFFAQDEYRVTQKLTLSYGLRYDIQPQYVNDHNDASQFNPTIPNPAAGNLLGGLEFLGPNRPRFGNTYYRGFGPRLGFAYSVHSNTVLRGSYGLYQAPVSQFSGETANRQGFDPQFAVSSDNSGVTPAFNWSSGFPTSGFNINPSLDPTVANGSGTAFMGAGSAHPPNVQLVNFSIQHQLPGKILLEAGYIGNFAHHLSTTSAEQINQLNFSEYGSLGNLLNADFNSPQAAAAGIRSPFPGFQGTVAQALRPYPQYLGINGNDSMIGNLTYNAGQFKAQKTFSNGLSFLVGYTICKHLTDIDSTPGYFAAAPQNAYDRRAEKSVSSIDFPQSLVISYTYQLPVGPGKRFLNRNGVISKYILGGWQVNGIHTYHSGDPLGMSTNLALPTTGDSLALVTTGLRPDRVPGVDPKTGLSCSSSFNPATQLYLNRGAFADPAPFTFGNAARLLSDVRGCGYANENIALQKDMPIKERSHLQIGVELFNAFNRVQFSDPNTNIDNSNFGTITGSGPGRGIQLHAKVLW